MSVSTGHNSAANSFKILLGIGLGPEDLLGFICLNVDSFVERFVRRVFQCAFSAGCRGGRSEGGGKGEGREGELIHLCPVCTQLRNLRFFVSLRKLRKIARLMIFRVTWDILEFFDKYSNFSKNSQFS